MRGVAVNSDWKHFALFAAFLVTLVPFYHGTQRFLDDEYRFTTSKSSPSWGLLFDFSVLFVEACALVALASASGSPDHFAKRLAVLLIIDIVWIIAGTGFVRRKGWSPKWAKVNIPTLVAVAILTAVGPSAVWLLPLAAARTVVDYATELEWYVGGA